MYCICCKKNNVNPLDPFDSKESTPSEEDLLWENKKMKDGSYHTINNGIVNNGIIQIIDAGYGSTHDGDRLILAICDECISKNLEDGTILYFSNYMGFPGQEEEIKKSKKIYRRRKNLDGLV